MDHLRAMAVFARVAEAGSFRAAASQLGISASVVSHHVTGLERYLDTPLIYRSTRKLSLTRAGEQLAHSAQTMVEAAQQGLDQIGKTGAQPMGCLKITAPAVFQYAQFVARVSAFMIKHPKVELKVNFSDQRHNIIEEGFDLAFRIGWLKDSSLKARKLADGGQLLCASPDYLKDSPPINHPADMERHELVRLKGFAPGIQLTQRGTKKRRTIRPPHRVEIDSGFAAMRMVEQGCGIAMLPDFLVRDRIEARKLQEVLPQWDTPSFGIYAVWPDNTGANSLRRLFVDFISEIAK